MDLGGSADNLRTVQEPRKVTSIMRAVQRSCSSAYRRRVTSNGVLHVISTLERRTNLVAVAVDERAPSTQQTTADQAQPSHSQNCSHSVSSEAVLRVAFRWTRLRSESRKSFRSAGFAGVTLEERGVARLGSNPVCATKFHHATSLATITLRSHNQARIALVRSMDSFSDHDRITDSTVWPRSMRRSRGAISTSSTNATT